MTEAATPRPAPLDRDAGTPRARPAATVVLLRSGPELASRGPEVLLTLRPDSMAFGGGLHVFPAAGSIRATVTRGSSVGRAAGTLIGSRRFGSCSKEVGVLLAERADGSPVGSDPRLAAELAAAACGGRGR